MKLPSHTTRYFAEAAYRLFAMTGKTTSTHKTVNKVVLLTTVSPSNNAVLVSWMDGYKVETIRKSWSF